MRHTIPQERLVPRASDRVYHRFSTYAAAARPWRIIADGAIVYDLAAIAALVSGHPVELERGYITSCWRKNTLHEAALATLTWPQRSRRPRWRQTWRGGHGWCATGICCSVCPPRPGRGAQIPMCHDADGADPVGVADSRS
jgi:hypothetical protein